jgi:hypothetical protein
MSRFNGVPGFNQIRKCFLVYFFLFLSASSFAQTLTTGQTLTSSPYSRYGLGELQGSGMAQNFSMGGSGIAYRSDTLSPTYINAINPASYSSLRITTIEMGMRSNTTQFVDQSQKFLVNNTSFAYMGVGLPINRWWGLAFGVMPYSTVGYNIHNSQKDSMGVIDYTYQGNGGINKVFVGNGFKLLKNKFSQRTGADLSVGFNAAYEFGSINNIRHVSYEDPNYYNTRVDQNTRIHDFTFDYGLQLKFRIDSVKRTNPKLKSGCARIIKGKCIVYDNCKVDSTVHVKGKPDKYFIHSDSTTHEEKRRVRTDIEDIQVGLGFTFAPAMNMSASTDFLARTYVGTTSGELYKDTILNALDKSSRAYIPMRIGMGLSLSRSFKWNILADYSYQQWSAYTLDGTSGGLQNSMQASIGYQFQLSQRGNYFKISRYRFGLKYNQTYLNINNTKLTEYAFTFGAAFPVAISKVKKHEYDVNLYRNYSMVNVGFELGTFGTTNQGLIQERYARVVIGFTINDRWFQHYKYSD